MELKKLMGKLDFSIAKEETESLKKNTNELIEKLKSAGKKEKIKFEIFVGGSFGKNTLEKSDFYDVDIFVRFGKKEKELSGKLERILRKTGENFEKVHGSRDYFRIKKENVDFEFIPVLMIKKQKEAENVTDLSYFHVNFVRRNLNDKLKKEILIAKKFCKAQKIYGAESYINGFSGYALECLIIYFKSFEKMLRELVKVGKEKKIIDIKKFYKKKEEIFININEAKTKSPIILVDPTWKERNVLAALNEETFRLFQEKARAFLKNPSENFFYLEKRSFESFSKKNSGEKVHLRLESDRQEGDIAGTKMKKFSKWILSRINEYFEILDSEFDYEFGQKGEFFIAAKTLGEVLRRGPSIDDKKNVLEFKKRNKKVLVRDGKLFAKIEVGNLRNFLSDFLKKNVEIAKEMGITDCKIVN